jgi:hypothetical protein
MRVQFLNNHLSGNTFILIVYAFTNNNKVSSNTKWQFNQTRRKEALGLLATLLFWKYLCLGIIVTLSL